MRFLLILISGILLSGCNSGYIPTPSISVGTNSPSECTYRGQLPDPICTPGATDPRVTQSNLGATICRSGYTATVRPPVSFTNSLKLKQMRMYGVGNQPPSDFEEDHLISLELGGAPYDPKNLWPEPGPIPNPKDRIENQLKALVCNGRMSLIDAQHRIATNWTTALL